MGRKRKNIPLNIKLKIFFISYFQLLITSFKNPITFSALVSKKSLFFGLKIYFFSIFIAFWIKIILGIAQFMSPGVFFLDLLELLVNILVSFLALFILGFILHILSLILGGRGNLNSSIKAVFYSFIPIIFFWLPFLRFISIVWILYLLTLNFKKAQKFSYIQSILTIGIPTLLIILMLLLIGNTAAFLLLNTDPKLLYSLGIKL